MQHLLASPLRNLLAGIAFMLVVAGLAIAAYVACGWSFGDSLYMVVMTVFTVGYGEVRPVSTPALRAVTITLITVGCTGMIFVTGSLVQLITASQFAQFLGVRRMQRDIDALSGHVIICGYGRIGQMLARDLRAGGTPFVIIERDEARVAAILARGYLGMQGDATDEDGLRAAGVLRARALATVLPNDAANVFITLTARSLNRDLTIIARGEAPSTEGKLLQAGAQRVVLPAHIGAERIAELLLYPEMAKLLKDSDASSTLARDLRRLGLELEVISAAPGSRCIGTTIAELEAAAAGAFLVVALERPDGSSLMQPPGDAVIGAGDGLALVGRPGRARAVQRLFVEVVKDEK
jgi:Trk K+ transport system NAD-binding subunit